MASRKQYPLRIPSDIWLAIEAWAADEMRSANGQIEWMLRESLRKAGRLPARTAAAPRTNARSKACLKTNRDTTPHTSATHESSPNES
ncbi:hypothetical protein HMPREF9248_0903 [Fannyhessea vaginae PB189-T1-4]|uniref:Arc-like DNA binding domain-containing protein n=1 Tax=Fannyhessea vaginae PB189-T1-4 TaxID=866774 RepID=A0ABN0B0D4_9ACTN|nr:hypothetical protein HMPREF9248_0903 [Fannyhessea vaginae PB189-T1-4]